MSDWITVSNRNKPNFNNKNSKNKFKSKEIISCSLSSHNNASLSEESILEKIHNSINEIKLSQYYQFISNEIRKIINQNNICFTSIILLGLGSISNSSTSLLQFIIYECICQDFLVISKENVSNKGKFIYEPNLTDDDISILNTYNTKLLSENLKGKYKVYNKDIELPLSLKSNETILFFLPHCPYRLYCNLLWENWDNLDKLYLIGNSFESYELRRFNNLNTKIPPHKQQQQYDKTDSISIINSYITESNLWPPNLIKTFLKEIKIIKSLIDLENAMCDLSFMYFSQDIKSSNILTDKLKLLKPSEMEIDEAALNDIELL